MQISRKIANAKLAHLALTIGKYIQKTKLAQINL